MLIYPLLNPCSLTLEYVSQDGETQKKVKIRLLSAMIVAFPRRQAYEHILKTCYK